MNDEPLTKEPPFWLVPDVIRRESSPELVAEWFGAENAYCLKTLKWSALGTGLAFLACIYLDVTYTPPASLTYALIGRGSLAVLWLLYCVWLSVQKPESGRPKFILYKVAFALVCFASVAYQLQYSLDYANRARYIPPFIFVLGAFALRVGPSFSTVLLAIYSAILGVFLARQPATLSEDLNLLFMAAIAVFIFQSRIRYEGRVFVADWKERLRLATSEKEAKLVASNAYRELVKVVYPHVVDLMLAGKTMEETMPVGHAKAAVLCFDIADSSTIQHERFDKAVEAFQGRLYDLMCKHYDGANLVADGYRIKDVGDGVFYSVGFPFRPPTGVSVCDYAVSLASEALRIFHEEMAKLDYPVRITAGVGIAYGHVEGFFPGSGLKQYDLRGRAIVLATRYQELRKTIKAMVGLDGASMVVISQEVFINLSAAQRAEFQLVDLAEKGIKVRNDHNAVKAYWRAESYGAVTRAAA